MKTNKATIVSLRTNRKNRKSGLRRGILAASIAALIGFCLTPQDAQGAAPIWSGGTSNVWNLAGNWSALPVSNDSLVFTGATGAGGLTLNNDLTSLAFNVAGITYNAGAAAFVINGNAFTLTGDIFNNGTNLETINSSFTTTGNRTIGTSAGGGNLTFGGAVTAGGNLLFQGAGAATFTQAITGGTTLQQSMGGTLTLAGTNVFTTGVTIATSTITGGTLNVTGANAIIGNSAGAVGISSIITVSGASTTFRNDNTGVLTLSGGVTGTTDLVLANNGATAAGLVLSTAAVNNTGRITNNGTGAGSVSISAAVGSNVTQIRANSATSALDVSGALTVNAADTTLTNNNTALLTLSGGVTGTGNLVLKNNDATAAGITLSTAAVNNTGTITNSGSGAGSVLISAAVDSNVTAINQNSGFSALDVTGVLTVNAVGGTTLSSGSNLVLLTLSGGVTGTGNLVLTHNGSKLNGITLSTAAVNNTGTITNNGDGNGGVGTVLISAAIGANVTTVTQNGASTLVISNAGNAYTGDTTITAGTLRTGAANVIPNGLGKGNVNFTAGAGTLDLNTFSQTINGLVGAVVGTTVDTVAGGTPTLTLGGNNATATFAGIIQNTTGTLALTKIGTGTQTLTGANTYTGGTTLNAGTLAAGSTKAFGSGNLTIAGGTVRTSGGPLSVNIGGGNIAANAGTALFNVGGTTAGVTHDQIATTGNFTFAGNGSTIALVQQGGYLLAPGDKVNLVTAAGGVQGGTVNGTPYANVTASLASFSNTPLLIPTVNRYLTTVTLEAMQGSFKALAGQLGMTPNQIAVASSLDSLTTITLGKTGIFKELNFLDTQALATLKSNLDKIAPEELTSIFHLGVSLSNIYGNNLDRRMQDLRQLALGGGGAPAPATNQDRFLGGAPGPRGVRSKKIAPPSNDQWGMFLTGSGEFTRVGSTTNASGYNFTTGGVTAGLDYRVNGNFAVGLSLGYANTTASLANGGSLDVDGGRLGLYATYFEENFHMDASVTGGLNSYRTRRVTPNNTIATASPNGAEINVKIGAGYDWKFGGLTVGPVISYQYTNMQLDGFTEAGAFAPLTVAGRSEESSRTSLGVRAYYDGRIGSKVFRPEVRLAWQHEFGATGYSLTSSFATLGGSPFIVSGTTIGRDSLLASAGFVIMWNDRLSTFVYYDGQFGSQNFDSHNVSAGMRLQF